MTAEYSIMTKNRYLLAIDEDEDPHELLEKQQEEKKRKDELAAEQAAKAKAAANKKGDKKNTSKSNIKRVVKPADTPNPQQTQLTNKSTYSKNDENRPPRFARQARDGPSDNANFEKPPQDFDNRERRGAFGARGRAGVRGGFNGNRPRREFERHSGSDKTGIKAVEKRDGSGPHNWGDDIQAQLEQSTDNVQQKREAGTDQTETTTTENEGGLDTTTEAEPVDEEPKEMTLDEWKASQTKTKADFKVRRANEGTDTKQWKGTVALQRKKKGDTSEEEYEEVTDDEEEGVDETRATLEKLNIQITFADSGRSGPRGGRGGGRGGRGGGFSSRGPRAGGRGGGFDNTRGGDRHSAPLVDNEAEFPSLAREKK